MIENKENNQESIENNKPIIYFEENQDYNEDKPIDESLNTQENKMEHPQIYKYIITTVISIILYSFCVLGANIPFTEIIDLELPLVIFLTIILTSCNIQGHIKSSYALFAIISCISYLISPNYTFFFIIALLSNVILRYVELIYYNKNDYPNHMDYTHKNMILKYFSRMKYYFLLSLIIFIAFVILGYFYAGIFEPIVLPSVQGLHEGVQQGTVQLETVSLFLNNFSVAMNMIIGGLHFSAMTIYLLIYNGLVIGYSACLTDLTYFLSFTLPHGIIELSAIVLAAGAGFRVSHALLVLIDGIKINKKNRSEIFVKNVEICSKMLSDVLIIIILIAVMLIIAAFIEANLTIPIGKQLMGMIYLQN